MAPNKFFGIDYLEQFIQIHGNLHIFHVQKYLWIGTVGFEVSYIFEKYFSYFLFVFRNIKPLAENRGQEFETPFSFV